MQLDVTESQETLDGKVAQALELFGRIDVLVNNAGYVMSGVWEEVSHEHTIEQFNTNVFGVLNLTRAILPHMRSRRSGTIVFISSIAGWRGAAAMGPYSSSKFALEGAVESLHKEVRDLNIETLLVVLGMFRTNILMPERKQVIRTQAHEDYDSVIGALKSRHEKTMGKQPGDPQVAVERIVDMVTRQGTMSGVKSLPLRMALGSDALSIIRQECEETLKSLESFQQFSRSTDFSEAEIIQTFQ
ncbi:hypothetical protein ZTR_07358 [Talaromyces verruculosus]|nr:hypothetical protein ZTR_07358 [Talaromyces verruculosus]